MPKAGFPNISILIPSATMVVLGVLNFGALGRNDLGIVDLAEKEASQGLCSKISGHSMIPGTSFRRRPESSASYAPTRGWYLVSGQSRSDEYITTGPIDVFAHRLSGIRLHSGGYRPN